MPLSSSFPHKFIKYIQIHQYVTILTFSFIFTLSCLLLVQSVQEDMCDRVFLLSAVYMYIKVSPHLMNGILKLLLAFLHPLESFLYKFSKFPKFPAHQGAGIKLSTQVFKFSVYLKSFWLFQLIHSILLSLYSVLFTIYIHCWTISSFDASTTYFWHSCHMILLIAFTLFVDCSPYDTFNNKHVPFI